jgi:hypothetical protein
MMTEMQLVCVVIDVPSIQCVGLHYIQPRPYCATCLACLPTVLELVMMLVVVGPMQRWGGIGDMGTCTQNFMQIHIGVQRRQRHATICMISQSASSNASARHVHQGSETLFLSLWQASRVSCACTASLSNHAARVHLLGLDVIHTSSAIFYAPESHRGLCHAGIAENNSLLATVSHGQPRRITGGNGSDGSSFALQSGAPSYLIMRNRH